MTLSDESKKSLEQVKKGKPRNFALVTKGVKIVALLVKKKPIRASETKDLKKTAKGQKVFVGVIDGRGQDITFKLLAEESEKPPGKELILKDYLLSQADFKCKPSYEIVHQLEPVDESEDSDLPVGETSPEVDPLAATITEQLKKYEPLVKVFVRNFEDRRVEILKPLKLAREFTEGVEGVSGDDAEQALATIKKLLQALAEATSPQSAESVDSAPTGGEEQWLSELAEVEPAYREALASNDPESQQLEAIYKYATDHAKQGQFAKALTGLRRLDVMLFEGIDEEGGIDQSTAVERWDSARSAVVEQLTELSSAIENSDHPQKAEALIEVKAVRANLTVKPDSLSKVDELLNYLETDDVVADVDGPNRFDIHVDVQVPLLEALDDLRPFYVSQ